MDQATVEERYLKVIKRFASLAGIWPYQSKFSKHFMRTQILIVMIIAASTQIARVVCFFNLDILMEQIPFIVVTLGIFVKQSAYMFNETKFKSLLDGIFKDWMMNRSKEELDIMIKYTKRGALFTSVYLGITHICMLLFINFPLVPQILNKIFPQNETKIRQFIYPAYYGLDEEKYYCLIITHMFMLTLTVWYVYVGCDSSYMYVIQHACGLLAVAGYRFKHAIEDTSNSTNNDVKVVSKIYKNVCYAIQGHERAIAYLKEIEMIHLYYLIVCLTMVMIAFSVTLVQMSIVEISVEYCKYCTLIIIQITHIFFLTVQGQFLINSNDEIYNTIYEPLWYNVPVKTQMLYKFALRRALLPFQITAGGMITMNLQSFAEIIKGSVSYFTVLKSR